MPLKLTVASILSCFCDTAFFSSSCIQLTFSLLVFPAKQKKLESSGRHTHTDGRLMVRETHTHTHIPCLQDSTDGRSPVRDTHTHTHTNIPCLQDRTNGRSPVRETHTHTQTFPAYKTAQMADRRSGRHTHTHTHTQTFPAYKTAQMADRRSGTHTHTHTHTNIPCLQDRTNGRSPVRETHTHTNIPCLQDRTDGRSPVRETHTHTHTHKHSLPTRPHRWQIAGQGHTHTHTHTQIFPAYKTAQMADRRSGRHTHTHTHKHTNIPCLQDRTDGRSPVREIHIKVDTDILPQFYL